MDMKREMEDLFPQALRNRFVQPICDADLPQGDDDPSHVDDEEQIVLQQIAYVREIHDNEFACDSLVDMFAST